LAIHVESYVRNIQAVAALSLALEERLVEARVPSISVTFHQGDEEEKWLIVELETVTMFDVTGGLYCGTLWK